MPGIVHSVPIVGAILHSPAAVILPFPAGFRFTCYYYRKSYYRAFAARPYGCAVPAAKGVNYQGERGLMEFRFDRPWLRHQAIRLGDPRSPAAQLGRQLNLPPSYLLIHRVTMGTIGVLCQLGGVADYRSEMERWQPGFAVPQKG